MEIKESSATKLIKDTIIAEWQSKVDALDRTTLAMFEELGRVFDEHEAKMKDLKTRGELDAFLLKYRRISLQKWLDTL